MAGALSSSGTISMSRSIPRAFAYLTLVLIPFSVADGAKAAVGSLSGGAIFWFAHVSPVQRVQSGECWEPNGPDGPGYYPCEGLSGGGPVIGPAIGLHRRNGVFVAHPHAANRSYSGVPSAHLRGVGGSASGAAGVHAAPGAQRRAAPVSPGLAGVHGPDEATGAHIAAPVSQGLTGDAGVPGAGEATRAHVEVPASPGLAGVHSPDSAAIPRVGAVATPHIAAPASPGPVGVGAVHAGGAVGAPRIGAPASPGLAGVHGPAGIGGGVGHR
jgi:hypothetical protein